MNNLLCINDLSVGDIYYIFNCASKLEKNFEKKLKGKNIVLFFPETSIRTRISYETAITKLGGSIVSFSNEVLDNPEDIRDVIGYIENWCDAVVLRHGNYEFVKKIASISNIPVINAMTSSNHPCEILSDIYSISMKRSINELYYLFIGPKTNIGYSWYSMAKKLGFSLVQACVEGSELYPEDEILTVVHKLDNVIGKADVIITDAFINEKYYKETFQINKERLANMKQDVIFNATPPFYKGQVISDDVELSDTKQFAGYGFKKNLLYVQAAIILYCTTIS